MISDRMTGPFGINGSFHHPDRRLGRPLRGEPQAASDAQHRGRGDPGGGVHLGGEQGHQGGPQHEAHLVGHRLQGERRVQPRRIGQQRAPPGPRHRAERGHRRAAERPGGEQRPVRGARLHRHDEPGDRDGEDETQRDQHPVLAVPVDEAAHLRRAERPGQRSRGGHAAGHGVAAGHGGDEQHRPEAVHRHRHPPDDPGDREAPRARDAEDLRVGEQDSPGVRLLSTRHRTTPGRTE